MVHVTTASAGLPIAGDSLIEWGLPHRFVFPKLTGGISSHKDGSPLLSHSKSQARRWNAWVKNPPYPTDTAPPHATPTPVRGIWHVAFLSEFPQVPHATDRRELHALGRCWTRALGEVDVSYRDVSLVASGREVDG